METNKEYILDFSYVTNNQKAGSVLIALKTFQEKLGHNYISFIQRHAPIGNIFGKHTLYKENYLCNIRSEDVMKQLCGFIGIKFKPEKLKYTVDLS